MSPENEMFEKQRTGIEQQLQDRWGKQVQVFKGFYFCGSTEPAMPNRL